MHCLDMACWRDEGHSVNCICCCEAVFGSKGFLAIMMISFARVSAYSHKAYSPWQIQNIRICWQQGLLTFSLIVFLGLLTYTWDFVHPNTAAILFTDSCVLVFIYLIKRYAAALKVSPECSCTCMICMWTAKQLFVRRVQEGIHSCIVCFWWRRAH